MVDIYTVGIIVIGIVTLINLFKKKSKKRDDNTKILLLILFFLIVLKFMFGG